jgi:hypothetical protein
VNTMDDSWQTHKFPTQARDRDNQNVPVYRQNEKLTKASRGKILPVMSFVTACGCVLAWSYEICCCSMYYKASVWFQPMTIVRFKPRDYDIVSACREVACWTC